MVVGGAFIFIGLLFSTPPGLPPDDILNFAVASFITQISEIDFHLATVMSYTVIPVLMILIGIMIYPRRNGLVVRMIIRRLQNGVEKTYKHIRYEPMYGLMLVLGMIAALWIYAIIYEWLFLYG